MYTPKDKIRGFATYYHLILWTIILSWTFICGLYAHREVDYEYSEIINRAEAIAKNQLKQWKRLREWTDVYGGVYVPEGSVEVYDPHLYQNLPTRITSDGSTLQRIHADYFIRHLTKKINTTSDTIIKIARRSSNPEEEAILNWDQSVIKELENGAAVLTKIIDEADQTLLRVVRPIYTKPECMSCHANEIHENEKVLAGVYTEASISEPWNAHWPNVFSRVLWIFLIYGLGIVGIVGVSYYVGRGRKSEKENHDLLQCITTSANDAIIMLNPKGNISFWNQAAEEVFGYKESDVIGKDLHLLLAPRRYYHKFMNSFPHFKSTGEGGAINQTVELEAINSKGFEFPIEVSLGSVYLNKAWHAIGVVRDIRDRKAIQKQLENALEEAKEASVVKSRFLANMSHEIRTPMNGIIGMTNLLLKTDLKPEQKEFAETTLNCANGLLTIINDILDFSKIEAGKLDLETIDFDLRLALKDANRMLAVKAEEKGIEYTCIIQPEVPSLLKGDPGRLRQVLTNLVGNALKFTEKGEVGVHVSVENEDDDSAILRFTIRDTGIGIEENKIESLFEAFSQEDSSIVRKFGGTGLGLAISKQIVGLMGGRIRVTSKKGIGSTFWFTARFTKQKLAKKPSSVKEDIQDTKVLIVDDNRTNRTLLKNLLTAWNCRHDEVSGGKKALELLLSAANDGMPFEVAIIDMQMPEMDGETLGRQIKANEILNSAKLIMMTSMGERGDAQRFAEAGFSAYLTKPVDESDLHDCICAVLGRAVERDLTEASEIITRHALAERKKTNVKILLAEDNRINQKVALKMLEGLGYVADIAENGKEVIEILRNTDYDIVFMDVQMPEIDGIEATRLIRTDNRITNPRVPIVAMTAHAMKEDREMCLQAGMDDYISKPVSAEEILEKLEKWVDGKRRQIEEYVEPDNKLNNNVFDCDKFSDRVGGDEEVMREIIQMFIEDSEERITKFDESFTAGDMESAAKVAHAMKGSCSNICANRLYKIAMKLEKIAKNEDQREAESMLGSLREEMDLFLRAVEDYGFMPATD